MSMDRHFSESLDHWLTTDPANQPEPSGREPEWQGPRIDSADDSYAEGDSMGVEDGWCGESFDDTPPPSAAQWPEDWRSGYAEGYESGKLNADRKDSQKEETAL